MPLAVSTLTLGNGLRVVVVKDPSAREVHVTMRYAVGYVDDPPDHPGMAHLVEHLMYQQTLGAQTLFAHVEDLTTSFDGRTTLDGTTYFEQAAPQHLGELLSIEAVRVGFRCTSINESAFEREREVVANELREHGDQSIGAMTYTALYPEGHPYRKWLRDTPDSVRAITRDQACAFADAHYTTGNAVLVVSGNLRDGDVTAALGKFLARVARRPATPQVTVAPVDVTGRRVEVSTTFDDDEVIFAWPLPTEPRARAQLRATMQGLAALVNYHVRGSAFPTEKGDQGARMLLLVVYPDEGEKTQDVIDGVRSALSISPHELRRIDASSLGELVFDKIKQSAIYKTYAALDTARERDTRLATDALAGRDLEGQITGELRGLNELTSDTAAELASGRLSFERATIVTLKGSGKQTGRKVELAPEIHDQGQRRDTADPALAHHALPPEAASVPGMLARTLPNGLRVVLLPINSVPTVDIRMVFAAGTADEPSDKRGVALLAGHALTWDAQYLNDMLAFMASGGTDSVAVGTDTTTFSAQGLDMHLDLLLAGIRRWVREGIYVGTAARYLEPVVRAERRSAFTDINQAWRVAEYGNGHPYVSAGIARDASTALRLGDAQAFREIHYVPGNATLVISGHFDAALANQWIDYLFGDWRGVSPQRSSPRATVQKASLAVTRENNQIGLSIELPATGDRAKELVIAQMIEAIAEDVRHQLGATYGLQVGLSEQRLAASYSMSGMIDAPRCAEILRMLSDRIDKLHTDPDAAARAFVAARQRVAAGLASTTGSASQLGDRVERDVALARAPMSDLQTAAAVRALTIDDVAPLLLELGLDRAAIFLSGPKADVTAGFAALGRTPTEVKPDAVRADSEDSPQVGKAEIENTGPEFQGLEPAITDQLGAGKWTASLSAGLTTVSLSEPDMLHYTCCDGWTLGADLGYRFENNAIGLHLGIGFMSGTYTGDLYPGSYALELWPIDIEAFALATSYRRLWGQALFGLHLDQITTPTAMMPTYDTAWKASLGIGIAGGVDIVRFGRHKLGLWVRGDGGLGSSTGYGAISAGVADRM